MNKKPIVNALLAFAYIATVVTVINLGGRLDSRPSPWLVPVTMISLLTLSAAVMGYLFCLQPLALYLDGKKKQAVELFLRTVLAFGVITMVMLGVVFSGVIK